VTPANRKNCAKRSFKKKLNLVWLKQNCAQRPTKAKLKVLETCSKRRKNTIVNFSISEFPAAFSTKKTYETN